jgi:O-antigen/teichoic acid export membrane protein
MNVIDELIPLKASDSVPPAGGIPKWEEQPNGGHKRSAPVRNILLSGLRLVIGAGASVCVSAIMARTLGPQNMGVFSYAIWIVGSLGILANVGLPHALTKYISEFVGSGDTATAVRICKRLLRTQLIAALCVAGLTASLWFLRTPYRSIIVLSAVMILLQALQQGLIATLAGVQRFDRIAWISLYAALAQVACVSAVALVHAGVMGMLWATLAGLGVGTWLSYVAVDKLVLSLPAASSSSEPTIRQTQDLHLRIRKFAMTISYLLVLDSIVWQRSEVLFLKWYSTLPQIAFYTLAFSISSKLTEVSSTFSSTLLPLYSESYGRNGLRDVGLVYANAVKYLQMLMVFPCFLVAAICGPLVALVYGPNYEPVVLPLQLLLISLAITSIGVVGAPLLLGTEKQSFMAKYGTLVAILNVALDIVLISKYGALGATVANCTAQIVGVVGAAIYVTRYAQAKFPWKTTATIYCAALVSVAPVAYCCIETRSGLILRMLLIAAAGILYLGLLALAGELGKREVVALKDAVLAKVYPSKLTEVPDVA